MIEKIFIFVSDILEVLLTNLFGKFVRNRNEINNEIKMNDMYSSAYLAAKKYHYIHHSQDSDWDCGVACARMVRQWYLGRDVKDLLYDINNTEHQKCFEKGRPLWTVEIFVALHSMGVNVSMCTLSAGIGTHHQQYKWYQDDKEEDDILVKNAIHYSLENSLQIQHRSLHLSELKQSLTNPTKIIAILLVNNRVLHNNDENELFDNFKGHYILILAFDKHDNSFLYLDPATDGQRKFLTYILSRRHLFINFFILF